MGRASDLMAGAQGIAQRRDRMGIIGPHEQNRARLFRARQHLHGNLRHHGQGAERAGHQFREVEAGDVLHHLATGLEHLAPAGHGLKAQEMIACRPRLDAPGAGQVGRDDAAQGAGAGTVAVKGA